MTLNAPLELAAHLKAATAAANRLAQLLAQASLIESVQPRATAAVPVEPRNHDRGQLWTVKDVAEFLGASTSWVYKASEAGRVPCIRIGAMLRFEPDQIRAFASRA